jgi:hypothetical protein
MHEQEQMTLTVQKWEQTILQYAHFQDLYQEMTEHEQENIVHDPLWLISPILMCRSWTVFEGDLLKQSHTANLKVSSLP